MAVTVPLETPGYDSEKHCGARTRPGYHCKRPKGWGTGHVGVGPCKKHFGKTPTLEVQGQRMLAQQLADRLSIPVHIHPYVALTDALAIEWGFVEHFRQQVIALDPSMEYVRPTSKLRRPLNEGKDGEDPAVVIEEITEAPVDVNIAIRQLGVWLGRSTKLSKDIASLGIDDRKLKLEEERGHEIGDAVMAILAGLNITMDAKVRALVHRELLAIDATCEVDT